MQSLLGAVNVVELEIKAYESKPPGKFEWLGMAWVD